METIRFMPDSSYRNVVGPACHRLRLAAELTQEQVAAKCSIAGIRLSRGTYAKIESQDREITDYELIILAKVFKVKPADLLPDELPGWALHRPSGHFKD